MVGVGLEGAESSLARVSVVNFYGAVQLDVFVRQRERVVDYRTEFSGVRPSNMADGTSHRIMVITGTSSQA
jgi:RNA exonuclease 4